MSAQLIGKNTEAAKVLAQYIERIENVTKELDSLRGDLRDIYAEAKGNGYDTKALRKVIQLRSQSASQVQEESYMLTLYASIMDLPLYTPEAE